MHARAGGVANDAIVFTTMDKFGLEVYVVDVLLPDLVGHDRRPAAFLVYLYLLRQSARSRRETISVSLQTIATKTGLSKSSVQGSIRHLKRRGLLDPKVQATVSDPVKRVMRPWVRGA
jgi:helix-turn-helix protein